MKKKLKIAIAGVGLVGKRHAASLAQLQDAALSAIVDPSEDGRAFAASAGVPCYETLEALFDKNAPDGLVLATPTPLHVGQGLIAIDRGCPVLVEKPLGTTAAEALALVAASETSGVPLLVGHHRRHNPLIQKAHQVISAGNLGELRAVQATCWFYKPDAYFDQAPWRKEKGAGPISVNLVHDIDLLRYLCGEVKTVQALTAPSRRGYANEDVAGAVLGFANGAVGTLTVSDSIAAPWSWELTSREYPIYPPTQESCYLIGGSTGSLSVPDLRLWSHSGGAPDWWTPISASSLTRAASDPLVNQMAHFTSVVRGETAPLVSGREGLRTLQVIEAIQKAGQTGLVQHIRDLQVTEKHKENEGV